MLNVMVVDDALVIRKNLTRFFNEAGHMVIAEAANGNEAIENAKKFQNIDLITMDITMPEMNGIDATKEIKKIASKKTKIVMITSHGQEELVHKSLKAGAANFILKPITKEKLQKVIELLYPEYANSEDEDLLD